MLGRLSDWGVVGQGSREPRTSTLFGEGGSYIDGRGYIVVEGLVSGRVVATSG